MSQETQTAQAEIKKCPSCKEDILKDATKCKHCGTDIQKLKNAKIAQGCMGIVFIIFIIIVIASCSSTESPSTSGGSTQTTADNDRVPIGQNGYLQLPDITDPNQKICLGETKDDADAISKALVAKDYIGLLEIPGAFCVGNGSQALVLEKSFPLTRVRITEGINEIDADKVGLSGWLPFEWVVNK